MKKIEDPCYLALKQRYLNAISIIHDLEVEQAGNRNLLKQTVEKESQSRLRFAMYRLRKKLASLNKRISAFYNFREI